MTTITLITAVAFLAYFIASIHFPYWTLAIAICTYVGSIITLKAFELAPHVEMNILPILATSFLALILSSLSILVRKHVERKYTSN